MRMQWEALHEHERFLPRYPSEEVVRFVMGRFPKDPASRGRTRILDIGCGAGRHLAFLAREGFKAAGTDFSEKGLVAARARLNAAGLRAAVVAGDMRALPYASSSYEGALAFGSFYYSDCEGFKKAVGELYRVLKPGGHGLVVTRTKRDCRFEVGSKLDANTCCLESVLTNESGMMNCFFDEAEVRAVFSRFSRVDVDLLELTLGGGEIRNSDWIVTVTKRVPEN
jgi:SAM-dependent methyltransferase